MPNRINNEAPSWVEIIAEGEALLSMGLLTTTGVPGFHIPSS